MTNLFEQARDIIREKGMVDLNDEERHTVGAAMIVVNHSASRYPDDLTVQDILTNLAEDLDSEVRICRR